MVGDSLLTITARVGPCQDACITMNNYYYVLKYSHRIEAITYIEGVARHT